MSAYKEAMNSLDFVVSNTQSIKGGVMGHRTSCRSNTPTPGPGYYNTTLKRDNKAAVFGYSSRDIFSLASAIDNNNYIDIYSSKDPTRPKSASFSFNRAELKRSKSRSNEIPAPGYYYVNKYKDKNVSGPIYKNTTIRPSTAKNSRTIIPIGASIHPKQEKNNFQKFSSLERLTSKNSKFYKHRMTFKGRKSVNKCKKVLENIRTAWKFGRKERIHKLTKNKLKINHLFSSAKHARERNKASVMLRICIKRICKDYGDRIEK